MSSSSVTDLATRRLSSALRSANPRSPSAPSTVEALVLAHFQAGLATLATPFQMILPPKVNTPDSTRSPVDRSRPHGLHSSLPLTISHTEMNGPTGET